MTEKRLHISSFLKQIPFLLVLCALLSQPIIQSFSIFSEDASYEYVDVDADDDTEEEVENSIEEDEKVTYDTLEITPVMTHLSLYHSHFYVQRPCTIHTMEILIPPPEFS